MQVPGHWSHDDRLSSRRSVLYRTSFSLPSGTVEPTSRHWLIFDGIWQSADVWFDSHYLGPTNGWFTRHEFDVTNEITAGSEHVLVVEVMAPPRQVDGPTRTLSGIFEDPSIVGHDNLGGIWQPVRLVSTGPVRTTKNRVVCTTANAEQATVHFRSHVLSDDARTATIVTTLRPPSGGVPITTRRQHELASGPTVLEWDAHVDDPELWWPWELGDQPMYRATVSVEIDGAISDIWDRTVGLRSVSMKNWILQINGERLFCRGADLWPSTARPADASSDQVAGDVALAKDLGLNLLRVESHIARPELYEAADRLGMLLWQDMPLRGEVKRTIQSQAVEGAHRIVDRLGAHPSIAIWCAHYDSTGTTTGPRPIAPLPTRRSLFGVARQQAPTWAKSVLDRLVARAFNRADGSRPVVQSSGTWPSAPRFDGTDAHLRFGWNNGTGRDLEAFARRIPRMVRWVSSFGAQSIPATPNVRVLDWPPDMNLLAERYGLDEVSWRRYLSPSEHESPADWILASQAYQAILLRRQIETLRRLKYRPTGGFTFAALADSRPAISFAIHDHDRAPKQAVGAVRAALRPVIIVADRLDPDIAPADAVLVDVHVVNDQRDPLAGLKATAHLTWTGGEHRWGWIGSVEADSVARIGSINWIAPDVVGPVELHVYLEHDGKTIADNHYRGAMRAP